ncbi:unnamed protein product [Cochlearia groenlandica]
MSEDSGRFGSEQTRLALGDLTNLRSKRGIDAILKSEDGSGKTVSHEESLRVKFSKRLCVVVDDLVKEYSGPVDTNNGFSSEFKNSSNDSEDEKTHGDGKEISFESGHRDDARDFKAASTTSSSSGGGGLALSVLSSETQNQQRCFELSRCSNVNKEEHVEDDLLKSCSCSFCLKAAYIWSDLQYQDLKGRLSVLKKSQKEASLLIQRNDKERLTDLRYSVNSASSANLESNLEGQWKSLFLSMGDILAHESNNLQNSFVRMKGLREDCKIDLERATKTFQDKI